MRWTTDGGGGGDGVRSAVFSIRQKRAQNAPVSENVKHVAIKWEYVLKIIKTMADWPFNSTLYIVVKITLLIHIHTHKFYVRILKHMHSF